MRSRLLVATLLLLCAAPLNGQDTSCELVRSRGTTQSFGVGSPHQVDHIPYPVFACRGGLSITADSAVFMHNSRQVWLHGNVVYADTAKSLTSDQAQYTAPSRHLSAQGNVVLEDLIGGSRIEAPFLDYYEPMAGRPQATIEVYSGRPRTTVVRERVVDGLPRPDTMHVDSDALRILGEDEFHFAGNVLIRGTDLQATGGSADFTEGGARMVLTVDAHVEAQNVVLDGDTIVALQDSTGEVMREVTARGNAHLLSEQVDVRAPAVIAYFDEGLVARMIALGRGGSPGAAIEQAYARSEQFNLVADSIDAVLPAQQLEQVTAVGNAYGERLAEDDAMRILVEPVTAEDSVLARILAHDWLRGDTVRAFFTAAPDSLQTPGDTAQARVLERIVASGLPARSAYRMESESRPDDPAAISYLTAHRITVMMANGAVADVEAEGDVKGVYLQPPSGAARAVQGAQ